MSKIVKQKLPLLEEGKKVKAWHCQLEVRERYELFGIGFDYKVWVNWITLPGPHRKNRLYEERPHGFLVTGLLKATNSDQDLDDWCFMYGIREAKWKFFEEAQSIERLFELKLKHPTENKYQQKLWKAFAQKTEGIKIENFGESYLVTANTIMPIIAFEVLELLNKGKSFQRCVCGSWYVPSYRQRTNHCANCRPPSRMPVLYMTNKEHKAFKKATLKRVNAFNKRKKDEKRKRLENLQRNIRNLG